MSTDVVLHHLAMKGLADAQALAHCTGLSVADVRAALDALSGDGLTVERSGRLTGFALTAAGRERHSQQIRDDPLWARREELHGWYERFESVNTVLKELCTAWQLVDGERPNDHSDPDYDGRVLAQLASLHERAAALLHEAGDARLARYRDRLTEAARAIAGGDRGRFTEPLSESYHDIWMELHHDLLTSFDRTRAESDA